MIKLMRLISYCPLPVLYVWAWFAAAMNCWVARTKRAVILNNLHTAFPEYSRRRIAALCRQYYFIQAEFLAEAIKLLSCRRSWLQRRVRLLNAEILEQANQARPILFLSTHRSNWEWASQALFLHCGQPFYGIYKPLRSPRLERLVLAIRRCFGGHPLPQQQFAKELIKHRHHRCFFYVLCDREPDASQKSFSFAWLGGQQTAFYAGTARLACALNCTVFFVDVRRTAKGFYEVSLEPLDNHGKGFEKALLEVYAEKLARGLQRNPANWYWGKPRWRWLSQRAPS